MSVLEGGGVEVFINWNGGGVCLGRPKTPPGGRAGSENDTLIHMTMTRDRPKFWYGLAWQSKLSYHPSETLAAEEYKKNLTKP